MRSIRTNPALSLHVAVTKLGPVTGATVRVSLKRNDVANAWLDFGVTPKVFKTSAWTNRYQALTEAGDIPGFYEALLDMSADFTLPAAVDSVIPFYEVTAPAENVAGGAGEEIFFDDKVDALNDATQAPTAAAIADAVWDELRAAHVDVGSYGEFTGDAAMRGTDGANTTVPLAAATDTAAHDQTQVDIAALMSAATHQTEHDATQAAIATVDTVVDVIAARMQRLDTKNIQTKLFYADAEITTGTRHVPISAASHMSVETRLDGAAFTGVVEWYVWFHYLPATTKDSAPASSTVLTITTTPPMDGSFSSEPFPS